MDRSADLAALASEANEHHKASRAAEATARAAAVESVREAMAAGRALTKVKAIKGHGPFGAWLKDKSNWEASVRWAQVYMRLAEHSVYVERRLVETKCEGTSHLTVSGLDAEIAQLVADESASKPRPKKERPRHQPTVVQPGDVVQLGNHVLICGDSRVENRTLLTSSFRRDPAPRDGIVRQLLLTDPPYGDERVDGIANNHIADWRAAWKNYKGDGGFVFFEGTVADQVIAGLEAVGFEIVEHLVWAKPHGGMTPEVNRRHESIYYVKRIGPAPRWTPGQRLKSTVLKYAVTAQERKDSEGHDSPKPIRLIRRLIELASEPGDSIYDPFCGAGATLLAAEEETDRRCLAVELNPFFCDVIVKRWQKLTKRDAALRFRGKGLVRFNDLKADPSLRPAPARRARARLVPQ